jgi:hypothetical protein
MLAGCATANRETRTLSPAPSSSYPKAVVLEDARAWEKRDASRRQVFGVQATGSMLPYFGSNAYLLVERNDGLEFSPGDIATLKDSLLTHRVRLVEDGALIMSGENVSATSTDGWVALDDIGWRVAGILYAQR